MVFALASFMACTLAQLALTLTLMLYLWHLSSLKDLPAITVATPVLVLFSAVLTVATIALNCICAVRARRDAKAALEAGNDGVQRHD